MFLIGDNYIIVLPPKWYSSIVKWPSKNREGFFLWALVNYLLIFDKSLKTKWVVFPEVVFVTESRKSVFLFIENKAKGGIGLGVLSFLWIKEEITFRLKNVLKMGVE
ncbi:MULTISPECIES: hypothetical protein [Peribacillus]|uniref:hypothetical protein n=1 Tax=Peribacillus TaxID=2675229 RepID=UPI0024E1EF46|nr:hypothetical protein [Peribacillus simplex]MDF9762144.1 hypothetical protein [Peribacillus simplex]